MRLSDIHTEYTKPNFSDEYEEMERYSELSDLSEQDWVDLCNTGEAVRFKEADLVKVNNTDATSVADAKAAFDTLEQDKRDRFIAAFNSGKIEMPIVLRMNGQYELLGGNTRATGLVAKGIMPTMWVVDVDGYTGGE